jgi:hypothetical protein
VTTIESRGAALGDEPPNINQFLDLIRKCTQLMNDQADDLLRSKRLARLLRRLDLPKIGDQPELIYRLGQIGEIVVPLETALLESMQRAFETAPEIMHDLGLTSDSSDWKFKQASFDAFLGFVPRQPLKS